MDGTELAVVVDEIGISKRELKDDCLSQSGVILGYGGISKRELKVVFAGIIEANDTQKNLKKRIESELQQDDFGRQVSGLRNLKKRIESVV